jgi:hypothetical protein
VLRPTSPERCLFFGHIFKMDEVKRRRACARCGVLEIDHAIEYLSSLRSQAVDLSALPATRGQQQMLTWSATAVSARRAPYLWGAGHRKPPVASRILKVEDNVITVRFGGKE